MAEAPHSSHTGERPRSVTLVAWGVFLLGLLNGWRAVAIFRQRELLIDLGVTLDPALIAAVAVVWSVLFIGTAITIYRRWRASRWITPVLLALYTIYTLALAGLRVELPGSSAVLVLTWLFSTGIVIIVIWVLNRKAARDYFVADDK